MRRVLERLSERERRLALVAGTVAAFVSILLFVDVPLYGGGQQMEKRSGEEQQRLKSIVAMAEEYRLVRDELESIRRRAFNGAGSALSGIEAVVGRSGLTKKMASVKPTTNPIGDAIKAVKAEIAFERISLSDLSRLVAAMESDGHPMAIEKIVLKASYEDSAAFNATLILNTVERE